MLTSRNRPTVWLLSLVSVALCIGTSPKLCGFAAGSDTAMPGQAVTGITISPSELVVSADYPASFVVTLHRADGTQQDLTGAAELQLEIADNTVVRLNVGLAQAARPSFLRDVPPDGAAVKLGHGPVLEHLGRSGETRLTAAYGGFQASAAVSVTEVAPQIPAFATEVSAVLSKSGCNLGTCHGNLHGKGGLRLSLRGDDPLFDFASITRSAAGRRIDWFDAENSLLLRKPAGQVAHRGGLRLPPDSESYQVMRRWLDAGALWDESTAAPASDRESLDAATAARVERLEVYPAEAWLLPEDREHRLVVIAELTDGTRRDVSRWARYEPSVPAGVTVSDEGWVQSQRPIDVSISISYLDGRSQARIVFLQPASTGAAGSVELAGEANREPLTKHGKTPIDELIEQRLERLRLEPMPPIPPELFLRRLFLTVAGRLPTAEELQQFLAEPAPDRNRRWIERALFDDGYAYLWALRWSDLLRNEPKVMSLDGAQRWNDWLASQFAADTPVDQITGQLVETIGSTFESPPASFHRTHREPEVAAEALSQVFLGVRIQCARCHNHPFDTWKQDDYYGLAAYFTTIERKQIDNKPRDGLDKHIISGDEIISLRDRQPRIHHPGRSQEVDPKPLDQLGWNSGEGKDGAGNPLEQLARWLTQDNRAFARNMANRVWAQVMGRGIVDPPDDFRLSNPPSNPELLEYITDRLIETGYSTRTLAREILNSDAFARQSVSQEATDEELEAAAVFAGYPLRRMSAEVLLDAISDATRVMTTMESEGRAVGMGRAVRHPGMPRDGFLRVFGKPDRLLSCECERSTAASLSQSLLLINGEDVRRKLTTRPNVLDAVEADAADPREVVEALYQSVLTRLPTAEEREAMTEYLSSGADRRAAAEDVLWALLNSQEFFWIR